LALQMLVLTPGQDPEVRSVESLTYDQIVEMVGWPIEMLTVQVGSGRAVMYVMEESNQKFPPNDNAHRLLPSAPNDPITGTALVLGPLGPGGVETSLPDQTLAELMEALTP
jgi:hypothetical protein